MSATTALAAMVDFARDGFAIVPDVLPAATLAAIDRSLGDAPTGRAGTRTMLEQPWCAALADRLRRDPCIAAALPDDAVAVQCIFFEKSRRRNWLVAMHQDVDIRVAERVDDAALAGWSRKEGAWHVQPPAAVLAKLVAIRVHLDACGVDDGALQVVPGSHAAGRLSDDAGVALGRRSTPVLCAVDRGGAMLMRPLLLHASTKARGTSRRRVLHFVFGPRTLPHGLRWPKALDTEAGDG